MSDLTLTCEGCGKKFVWTEKEQEEAEQGGGLADVEPYCRPCRPKQDQERS